MKDSNGSGDFGMHGGHGEDPLGVYETVDTDDDGIVSEDEFDTLSEGILEVTGTSLTSGFSDFDLDEDSGLSGEELQAVLDEAGLTPPEKSEDGDPGCPPADEDNPMIELLGYYESTTEDIVI